MKRLILLSLLLVAGVVHAQGVTLPFGIAPGPFNATGGGTCAVTSGTPLPSAKVSTAYSDTLGVNSSCSGSITYSLVGSILPNSGAWLGLSSSGVLSGTPSSSASGETEGFTVQASDSAGHTATQAFTLQVIASSGGGSGGTETQVFNITNPGSAVSAGTLDLAWESSVVGSTVAPGYQTGGHNSGGVWYYQQQPISSFDYTWLWSYTGPPAVTICSNSSSNPCILATAFVVQESVPSDYSTGLPSWDAPLPNCVVYGNSTCGNHAGQEDANLCGFGQYYGSGYTNQYPLYHSVAICIDSGCNNGSYGGGNFFPGPVAAIGCVSLEINGGTPGALTTTQDMTQAGINLHSGHAFQAHTTYDGANLRFTIKDTTTGATYRTSWKVNIASIIGSTSGWVGHTAGEGPGVAVPQGISAMSFSTGLYTTLAAPSISPGSGVYGTSQTVTIICAAGTAYYSTNGHNPTTGDTAYTGPFSVSTSEVVQAICSGTGYTDSFASSANYLIQSAATPNVINQPIGWTNLNEIQLNGSAVLNGTSLQLTDGTYQPANQSGSAYFPTQVSIAAFHWTFTIQMPTYGSGGMGACIQDPDSSAQTNSHTPDWVTGGPNALAPADFGFGFMGNSVPTGTVGTGGGILAGLKNAVCIKFDGSSTANSVGLYRGLTDPTTGSVGITGLNLNSGDPIKVALAYDGSTYSMTMTDTSTNGTFTTSWPNVNIPGIVGASTAYVGLTSSDGYYGVTHDVLSMTFTNP